MWVFLEWSASQTDIDRNTDTKTFWKRAMVRNENCNNKKFKKIL